MSIFNQSNSEAFYDINWQISGVIARDVFEALDEAPEITMDIVRAKVAAHPSCLATYGKHPVCAGYHNLAMQVAGRLERKAGVKIVRGPFDE